MAVAQVPVTAQGGQYAAQQVGANPGKNKPKIEPGNHWARSLVFSVRQENRSCSWPANPQSSPSCRKSPSQHPNQTRNPIASRQREATNRLTEKQANFRIDLQDLRFISPCTNGQSDSFCPGERRFTRLRKSLISLWKIRGTRNPPTRNPER